MRTEHGPGAIVAIEISLDRPAYCITTAPDRCSWAARATGHSQHDKPTPCDRACSSCSVSTCDDAGAAARGYSQERPGGQRPQPVYETAPRSPRWPRTTTQRPSRGDLGVARRSVYRPHACRYRYPLLQRPHLKQVTATYRRLRCITAKSDEGARSALCVRQIPVGLDNRQFRRSEPRLTVYFVPVEWSCNDISRISKAGSSFSRRRASSWSADYRTIYRQDYF